MCILHCNPKVSETCNHFHCIFCHMFSYDSLSYKIMNLCTGSLNQGPKYLSKLVLSLEMQLSATNPHTHTFITL